MKAAFDLPIPRTYNYLSPWNPLDKNANLPEKQVVTCFLQKKDKILVLQRARQDAQHGLWGIPGGKLDKGEFPINGLIREIYEETSIKLFPQSFQLLKTAMSYTPSDGQYGLYLYHAFLTEDVDIQINSTEHYEFRWVTLDEFKNLKLLTAQGEAFRIVENQLKRIIKNSSKITKEGKRAQKKLCLEY